MKTVEVEVARAETRNQNGLEEASYERWAHCHVNWTAVWVGALATLSVVLLFGLVGIAMGAHLLGPEHRVVDLKKIGIWTLVFSVCSAFFSGATGGWVAGKIAGILHSEPAMLHGAIAWLLTVPILLVAASLGAASIFGGWYAGLGAQSATPATAPFVRPDPPVVSATTEEIAAYKTQLADYHRNMQQWREETPRATRNAALGAITALLLGLIGSVIGGWMASGEPMNFTHYRSRTPIYHIA